MGCSFYAAPAGEIADGRVPIGRPIANARMYVVDSAFMLRPPGAPGELVLGGEILARGYLDRPDLTAERFVPDPFGEEPGGRLYRTGDLALRRHTGSFEFLGRDDDQVKVRGYRIELGEVEAALERHPRVRSAVVAVRETALAGYVVAAGEPFPTAGELRGFLQERLPPYMIPATFVFLDRLPLTPHGKVDRRALAVRQPAPEQGAADSLEAKLAELWAAVLGLDQVGIGDDFFALGGHSLSALRLASRIRETFGVRLPTRRLFAAPTPAAMAELLREMPGEARGEPGGLVVALQPRGVRAPFFCVHPGGGDVTAYRELALSLDSGHPFLALRAPGLEEGEEPLRDIGTLAERHLREMRRAQPEGPWHLGGWSAGAVVAFEMARRLRAADGEVASLVLLDPPDLPFTAADPDDAEILASPQAAGLLLEEGTDLERRLRVFRASLEALRSYQPGSWDGPLTLLEAAARPAPATFWRTLATAVATVPGDHATILQPPQVEELARRVREALG